MLILVRIAGPVLVSHGMSLEAVDSFSCFEFFLLALVQPVTFLQKLLMPLVKYWRSKGRRVIVYIDDGICAASTLREAEEHCTAIQADLGKVGFILKSKLDPHQVGDWLGFIIDLALGYFHVPEGKIEQLKDSTLGITQSSRVHIRTVAGVVGQIISMSLALGPTAWLRTRALYAVINSFTSWNAWVTLTEDAAFFLTE